MINKIVYEGNLTKTVQLFEDVYLRLGNLEFRDQCNCGFVELDHAVAIIDYTGQQPDEELIDEAERIIRKPVKYIFLTHADGDHVDGFRTLKRQDVSLIASKASIEYLQKEGYPLPPIHKAVTEDEILLLDGFTFKLELPGRIAHSSWDLLIGLPKYKLLFTGDMIVRQKYMYFHNSCIKGWKEAVEMLKARDWQYLAMGHGTLQDKSYLQDIGIYLDLLSAAKDFLAANGTHLDEKTVMHNPPVIPRELIEILAELIFTTDLQNAVRQVNQLDLRTRQGY